jgi:tellurite methyltransferase
MADSRTLDPPSRFVTEWAERLNQRFAPGARVLDVAMGHGRHAIWLARAGYRVFGVDIRFDAVRHAVERAAAENLRLRAWCADLTMSPLPTSAFELVLVTRYLQRNLFETIRGALVPGGVLICETFTTAQMRRTRGPRSPDHLLRPGELRVLASGFELLHDEEIETTRSSLARIVGRKPPAQRVSGSEIA